MRMLGLGLAVTGTALILMFVFSVGAMAPGGDKPGAEKGAASEPKANPGFERMQKLVGDWEGTAGMGADKHPASIRIQSTAGGSALLETEFCGTEHEMITMIYRDKDDLVLTHYCHLANQPHMKGKVVNDKEILFEFAGGSNIDPKTDMHMHQARYQFIDDDHFTSTWTLFEGGKAAGDAKMEMTRKKSADK